MSIQGYMRLEPGLIGKIVDFFLLLNLGDRGISMPEVIEIILATSHPFPTSKTYPFPLSDSALVSVTHSLCALSPEACTVSQKCKPSPIEFYMDRLGKDMERSSHPPFSILA